MAAIIGGAIGSSIPNIFGGFAPFPNTIATALLAYQSEAIGFGFGIKFQYAKRLVGAMTNEQFNGLDASGIGNIIEAHNTELIQRMANEMPKWLQIQHNFIEASVSIEIAKANRTPSAWAEIIQAFSSAAGQQIADSLDTLDPTALAALLAANPILALIYSFSKTNGGTTAPTPPPIPDPVALPTHQAGEDPFHSEEEHMENIKELEQFNLEKQITAFGLSIQDPVSSTIFRFTTITGNLSQHRVSINTLANTGFPNVPSSANAPLLKEYKEKVSAFYNVTI